MRFLGTIDSKTDAKGRVFLPASFRKVLSTAGAERLVLRKDIFQPCLVLYPESVWNQMLDSLRARLNRWNRQDQMVFRQFVSDVEPVALDGNGRFLIPRRYQQMAGIEGQVRFIGMNDAHDATLASNKVFTLCMVLAIYWIATFIALKGLGWVGKISKWGGMIGTIIPAGLLILLGVLLGRFICGFLCPFGWLQDLLHKIPGKKLSTKKVRPLTYIKYAVLAVAVVLLPALVVNDVGLGDPFFCKYICPQGVLEGAIPLSIANQNIRNALGELFTWKLAVLVIVVVLSIIVYRPFCKWLCPLGALYALFNRVSLFRMAVDKDKCISCGKCARVCKMDVDVTKTPNHTECIRCGKCVTACPTEAVRFCYGFGDYKNTVKKTKTEKCSKDNDKEEAYVCKENHSGCNGCSADMQSCRLLCREQQKSEKS